VKPRGTALALLAAAALVAEARPRSPRIAELFAALSLDYTVPWAIVA